MTIKAEEAQIKTATVEIKILTVSGKQMTLAVYRQIKEENIFINPEQPYEGTKGPCWGIINYHTKDCDLGARHLHLVWQKGKHLRRFDLYSNSRLYGDFLYYFKKVPQLFIAV
jgi:hypothetical protein